MASLSQMNVRMESQLKAAGDDVLARMGVTPTQLVRAVWMKVAQGAEAFDQIVAVLAAEPAAVSGAAGGEGADAVSDEFEERLHSYISGKTTFIECRNSDRAFHKGLVEYSGNRYLAETYRQLEKKLDYLSIRTCEFVASGPKSDDLNILHIQHSSVLNAIKMSFPELAREAASTHIDFCLERSIKNRYLQSISGL